VSKFFGFLLGVVVALAGPAVFGVLAADGGIELNAKEMALAYGIGALIFWTVVSYFSGAAALGAALTFGAMIYTVHWIPNRMTNFLNDVPGVTTGMIDGIKQYTLNGVVPILAVISLVYGIQLIVQAVQRRRRERAEADRLQREQELAHAQQAPEATAAYPVAGGYYQPSEQFGENFGNSNYDDLFDEEPTPYPPRNQADEQTAQFASSPVAEQYDDADRDGGDETREHETGADETGADEQGDETVLVPTDRDETVLVPTGDEATDEPAGEEAESAGEDETVVAGGSAEEEKPVAPAAPVAGGASEAAVQEAPSAKPDPPQAPAPQPDQPPAPQAAAAPQTSASQTAASPAVPRGVGSRREEVGQQYRERMDGPDVDDTGEFQVGAFEAPPEYGTRVMDLPGQFRPAGA
jgi:hypothetical protein